MYLMPVVTHNISKYEQLLYCIKNLMNDFEFITLNFEQFKTAATFPNQYKIIMFDYDRDFIKHSLNAFREKHKDIIIIIAGEEFSREERIFFIEKNIYYIDKWKTAEENARYISKIILNKINIAFKFSKKNWFEFTISSIPQFGLDVSEFIANLSMQTPLKSEDIECISIILTEIQNNAMEHGNKSDELKKIKISGAILENCLIIKIEDEGSGFDTSKLMNPFDDLNAFFKNRESQNKRPGGLGLAMADKIMDSITFNEKGNSIIMTKYY